MHKGHEPLPERTSARARRYRDVVLLKKGVKRMIL